MQLHYNLTSFNGLKTPHPTAIYLCESEATATRFCLCESEAAATTMTEELLVAAILVLRFSKTSAGLNKADSRSYFVGVI